MLNVRPNYPNGETRGDATGSQGTASGSPGHHDFVMRLCDEQGHA